MSLHINMSAFGVSNITNSYHVGNQYTDLDSVTIFNKYIFK